MPRNIVQDVVPGKRSIKDIPVPSRRTQNSQNTFSSDVRGKTAEEPMEKETTPDYGFEYDVDRSKKSNKWIIWTLVGLFVLAGVFGISSLFASGTLTVIPKSQTVPINLTLSALKDQATGQFGYQIVSTGASVEGNVPAGKEQQVDKKAEGTIVVYNTSNAVQNLVINTRFQSTGGLIFHAIKAVSVPKATTVSGKSVPGSTSVDVIADQTGDTYNINLSDFTLPGLKGSPQFSSTYGRSKTTMFGGFSGMMSVVDDATMQKADADLTATLQANLKNQITSQIPKNFVLFPQSLSYSFTTASQKSSTTTGQATLTKTGTVSAIIFDRALLSRQIISMLGAPPTSLSIPDGQAEVKNLDGLVFTLKQPTAMSKDYSGSISFSLTGDAKIVWFFDTSALKNDLLGLQTSKMNALLQAKYPTISQARAKVFPVWKRAFPSSPDKISIVQTDNF